jgi:DNA transformation protein
MTLENDFVEYLVESLSSLGPIRARKMFGGYGIFWGELMFGLVSKNVFYLKADQENRPDFVSRSLGPFKYKRKGKEYAMSYYQVPDEAIDDVTELCKWAKRAHDAAVRALESKLDRKGG